MFALRRELFCYTARTTFYLRRRSFLTVAFLQKIRKPRSPIIKELARIVGDNSEHKEKVLRMFLNEKERLYLPKVTPVSKLSAYNMMRKDRAHKLPVEDRSHYVLHKASEDFKSLSAAERKHYQEMAETLAISKRKEYEEKLKMKPCPPRHITPFMVMRKCRMAEVPREERHECFSRTALKEYRKLSASDLSRYTEVTDKIYDLKMKMYEKSMERWKATTNKLICE